MTDVRTLTGASLAAAFRSDPGRVRTNNEDLPLVDAVRGVYGVIDGVGGQAAGEIAASLAREVIQQRLARPLGTPAERVREALAIANNEIFKRSEGEPALRGMACVATLAIVSDDTITIGHVGDTRLYTIGPGGLRKLTHDHSPIGEREDAQELSEAEAMRHPRRNEVFRDIGSAYRDKDEDEFVEVIVEPFERDRAILLCSDGLTDMLPSTSVERLVRAYAGSPQDVVDALVTAANDAGGKDNVTVVYAEPPGFAALLRRSVPSQSDAFPKSTAADDLIDIPIRDDQPRPETPTSPPASAPARGLFARLVGSRTTWFSAGALAGVLVALAIGWRLGALAIDTGRTLVVDPGGTASYRHVTDAMAVARPGDIVRLEPGMYRERIVLGDGVDLAARIPGTAIVARPSNANGEVVGISVFGALSSSISGIRFESTDAQPLDIAVRLTRQGTSLDQLDFAGPMRTAIDVAPFAAVTVRGSWFGVQGPALTLGADAQGTLTSNVLLRAGRSADPAIGVASSSQLVLRRNVFAGFGPDVIKGMTPTMRQQVLIGNFVIPSEPSLVR
jgi:PPM family protein phosphatase